MRETIERLLQGDQRALSRLISLVETRDPRAAEVMEKVYPYTGRAYCIGVTGPPGVGKSTIVDRLAELMRGRDLSVAIIAVDPSSPYSGGAFLGDRIRMQRHYLDPGVFIRSIATRGSLGGLPRIVHGAVRLMDASGKDIVMVETVGVGQAELGIMGVADTVIVTLVPEAGDVIQTLKSGLMEISDIYVVNKADREGADRMAASITSMLTMDGASRDWMPPVLTSQARNNEGVLELYEDIQRHRDFLEQTSRLQERRQVRRGEEFLQTIEEELGRRLQQLLANDQRLSAVLDGVKKGEVEPYSAAFKLLDAELSLRLEDPVDRLKIG